MNTDVLKGKWARNPDADQTFAREIVAPFRVFRPIVNADWTYQRPFRIVQDVMLDPSREAAGTLRALKSMMITATLNYQACDDKLCFNPQSCRFHG